LTKFQLSRADAPWDYPTLGFRADTPTAILDGSLSTPAITTPPDAYWSVYGGGSAETGITRYGNPTADPASETPEGYVLAYSDEQNRSVPTAPADWFAVDTVRTEVDKRARLRDRRRGTYRQPDRERVMATPPTVSVVGPINSSLYVVNPKKLLSVSDMIGGSYIRWRGGDPTGSTTTVVNNSQAGSEAPMLGEFMLVDDTIEMLFLWSSGVNTKGRVRILVDDEYVSLDPICVTPIVKDNYFTRVKLTFPTVDVRKIGLELFYSGLTAISVNEYGAIFPTAPDDEVVAILGDSITSGSIADTASQAWWAYTCRKLRWGQPWPLGQGGTGFLNPSAISGQQKFIDRLDDVAASGAKTLIIAGCYNDKTTDDPLYTPLALGTAVTAVLDAIPTSCPLVEMTIVIGAWQNTGSPAAPLTAAALAAKTAAEAHPVCDAYIDTTGWATGTQVAPLSVPRIEMAPTVTAAAGSFVAGTYYYVVTAVGGPNTGETTASNEVSAVVATNGKVDLYWTPVTFANTYRVYRATTPGGTYTRVATGLTTATYADSGAAGTANTPSVTNASGSTSGTVGTSRLTTMGDGVHLSTAGHRWLGGRVVEAIKAALPGMFAA
jgi:hypothetical protein